MSGSRRDFVKQLSAVAALGLIYRTPGRELWTLPAGELVPEPDEALLARLATTAVEAARQAGATFADVRVTAGRQLYFEGRVLVGRSRPEISQADLASRITYGVRAIVDGAWGAAGGSTLTAEAVVEVARTAVARARANRPRQPRTLELAPVPPVAQGRWETPIGQDPFAVPLQEQADLLIATVAAAEGVRGTEQALVRTRWTRQTRVFASSEGTLLVQRVSFAAPQAAASGRAQRDYERVTEQVPGLHYGSGGGYGYEILRSAELVTEMRQAAERAIARSRSAENTPLHSTEVGRYDLVLGGKAVAKGLRETLAEALNLERALGYRANTEGTSFAAPPAEILGTYQVGSPLVTVRADRTRPHGWATVGWDDEGVPAGEHTLIQDGVVVDYLTTRQTAGELAAWYESRGEAVRSRGCAVGLGQEWPEAHAPNLTLAPGQEALSAEDLIADTKRGFYVEEVHGGASDPQLLSGQFATYTAVREIRQGKLGRYIRDFAFQFLTPQFWKNVDALGGAASIAHERAPLRLRSGPPRAFFVRTRRLGETLPANVPDAQTTSFVSVSAVPVRVRQVNVLNTGRTA